jgi:hypothetical protein
MKPKEREGSTALRPPKISVFYWGIKKGLKSKEARYPARSFGKSGNEYPEERPSGRTVMLSFSDF